MKLGKVDDEIHMFSECTLYDDLRQQLRDALNLVDHHLFSLGGDNFFLECMKATNPMILNTVADFVYNDFKKREVHLCR